MRNRVVFALMLVTASCAKAPPSREMECAAVSYLIENSFGGAEPKLRKMMNTTAHLSTIWFLDQLPGDRADNVEKMKRLSANSEWKPTVTLSVCNALIPQQIRQEIFDAAMSRYRSSQSEEGAQ